MRLQRKNLTNLSKYKVKITLKKDILCKFIKFSIFICDFKAK